MGFAIPLKKALKRDAFVFTSKNSKWSATSQITKAGWEKSRFGR